MALSKEKRFPSALFLVGMFSCGVHIPSEEDRVKLAEKLENDPPPEFSAHQITLLTQIIRGDGWSTSE